MRFKKKILKTLMLSLSFALAACGNMENQNNSNEKENTHEGMNHKGSPKLPNDLKEDKYPAFEVGSKAVINADHMEGMKGAKATIVGAYETTAYAVSYTPTTGGNKIKNHKWVIQEDIKDAGNESLKPGTVVKLNADHMKGMKGAKAVVDWAEQTTVYLVDYTPATSGKKVTNHKWLTENELTVD
ncbi:YdhK family protein [Fictibacillus aquaticus]|uniref:DUF1541 domain-containing protein n=1 Tax=Fictibacillus aquaticus TaxID=2021314 RepID=A0A235F4H5_9BACL|nr:YdhK family protein [Fictibacillus aquaticus]OYD55993.1 hypothetical protein CGZ90_19915 [Fictibacillus aquaticus]